MKRILYLYKKFNTGGAQKVVLDLVNNLGKDYFVAVAGSYGDCLNQLNNDIKYYNLPLDSKKPHDIVKSIYKIIKIVKENKIQYIHSHHRFATVLALIASRFCNVEVIHTEHNVFPNKNMVNFRGKNIIAVSEAVSKHLIENKVDRNNITIISNGITIYNENKKYYTLRNKYNIPKQSVLIGVIARLSKEKGHIYLLEAIKRVLEKGYLVKLCFVGEGDEKKNIEEYIKLNNLNDCVILTGNRNDIINIIQEFNFCVLPSIYEGLPISMLEIMSQKRILIATGVGGVPEVISNYKNGIIVQPKNIEQLVNGIIWILNHKEEVKKMENDAFDTIINKFSITKMIEEHKNYYSMLKA